MNEYQDIILDHYRDPQNFGELSDATHSVELRNLSCGDYVKLTFKASNGSVEDVAFSGKGCAISTAAASMLTEEMKGKRLEEIQKMTKENILEMLGVEISAARLKCALMPLEAAHKAIAENNE